MKDNAVSPTTGVILMVAITVILAAVIAAIVFGMAGKSVVNDPTEKITITVADVWIDHGSAEPFKILTGDGKSLSVSTLGEFKKFKIDHTYACEITRRDFGRIEIRNCTDLTSP